MAYNMIFTDDGHSICVSDDYLAHVDVSRSIGPSSRRRRRRGIEKPPTLPRQRGVISTGPTVVGGNPSGKVVTRPIQPDASRTRGERMWEQQHKIETRAKSAQQAAAKRKKLMTDATGLKAASNVAVNYLEKNGWVRSRVNPSDGMNKCIFTKTANGKTKTLDIPIAVFEDSLVKRAEQTGFSISKYADTIRNRLKEAKDFDKQR